MKSTNLFAKVFNLFLFVLVSFAMSANLVGSASAKSDYPGCKASASAMFGPAPLTVDFSATSPNEGPSFNWGFGDGKGETGADVTHTFTAEGNYRVRAFVTDVNGFYNTCALLIVKVGPNPNTTPVVAPVLPTPVVETPVAPVPAGTTSATGSIDGDNNIAPVINGDNNKVIIKIAEPAPVVETVEPKPLTFGQKFWLPWKTFWSGVVTILVGWFDLNIP